MNTDEHLPATGVTHTDLNIVCAVVWDDPKSTPVMDIQTAWHAGLIRYGWRFNVARAHPATIRILMRARDTRVRLGAGRIVRAAAFADVAHDEADPVALFRGLMRAVFDDAGFKVLGDYDYPVGDLLLFDTSEMPVKYARLRAI
jgi:hypothetical protein